MSTQPHDLLVLGDLHLGGSLRPPLTFKARRAVVRLDRELARFLDFQAAHPNRDAQGRARPWTLVLNGDCIDFLHLGLVPDGITRDPAEDEAMYGLDFDESRSRWKLACIVDYHRHAFAALCRFIEAGHQIVFIAGNHDADLCFPQVQRDLRGHIARFARGDREAVKAAVRFSEWFHHEPHRAWFEHGHRFDPYNTFPDPLEPIPAGDAAERRISPTFSHWGLRYFANRVRNFPLHDLETWTARQFLHWAWYKAGMGILRLVLVWGAFLLRYVRDTAGARLKGRTDAVARARRRTRLRALARSARLPVDRMIAIDALHLPHVGASLGRLMLSLYADRVALGLGVLLVLGVGLPNTDGWFASLVLTLAVLGAAWAGARWLDRRRPQVDVHPVLGRVADRIGRLARAPVVVFGHTHRPVLRRMGRTRWLNPGSWEHVGRHTSPCEGGGVRCRCDSRFAIITGSGRGTRAHLMAWCQTRRRPRELSQA